MEAVAKCSNLVLPKGFVELDREEMTYVDGGWFWNNGVSTFWTGVAIDATIMAIGIGIAASGFLKALKFAKIGRIYIRTNMKKFIIAAGFELTSTVCTAIWFVSSIISNINSIGSLIANVLDYADGNYDGRIKF